MRLFLGLIENAIAEKELEETCRNKNRSKKKK